MTPVFTCKFAIWQHFNPHLPRGRWLQVLQFIKSLQCISIHTFLAEGDWKVEVTTSSRLLFQSTPSSRKVTSVLSTFVSSGAKISIHTFLTEGDYYGVIFRLCVKHFNPHLPHGRWQTRINYRIVEIKISIHTFLTEGDPQPIKANSSASLYFNPHLPHGRWPF